MIQQPAIIASYPRSGSTWLRFVLCHLFYPDVKHDFDTVNIHIPPIDEPNGLLRGIDHPVFYKTHGKSTATNVIFLHRHVGDVLESEWWYKKKVYGEDRSIEDYLEATEFGKEWREFTEHYFPARNNIAYLQLNNPEIYFCLWPILTRDRIQAAIEHADFATMQHTESVSGLGIYPEGDKAIKFCRKGTSDQWRLWAPHLKEKLLSKNKLHLKMLGYAKLS